MLGTNTISYIFLIEMAFVNAQTPNQVLRKFNLNCGNLTQNQKVIS